MELAHYLMMASMKRSRQYSSSSSWEEKAFAEDHLGGMVWPPRSYSCSFCNREFKSAQALGGHMNVHRRDRARLKNSSSSNPNPSPNPSLFRVSTAHKEDQLMISQKERSRLVVDDGMELKRVKVTNIISSTMFAVKKCSSQEGTGVVEELDLELRLGSAAKLM